MKIYVLPVNPKFQPDYQTFASSPQQKYGVEQDFLWWLKRSEHITDHSGKADWNYLPLFWNRCYINWNWGKDGLDEIQGEILRLVTRARPTFTICEYDVVSMQPFYDLCGMIVFCASRHQADKGGIDIPLMCLPHQAAAPHDTRRWLASFVGNLRTHTPRPEMDEILQGRADCQVEHANQGTDYFVNTMLDSYLALCPRGYGGQSFRFYEAMQLGVAPLLIGDIDARPFKRWLPWDRVSLYLDDVHKLPRFLDGLDRKELIDMGRRAQDMYEHCLQFGQWPRYVIKELGG